MTPEQLAARLAEAIPRELKCVVLYGSAAGGDFLPGASNYNLLILLAHLSVAQLDAIRPTIVAWRRAGHAPPLVFTTEGFAASTDAFPIELLDIRQSRRVLWGDDLLVKMDVHPEHLRLQVERELTGKLLSLRSGYLLADGKQQAIVELMSRALSTILVLFRAALRLYQADVPAQKLDALHALRKHIEFDVEPFERLFKFKQGADKGAATQAVSFDAFTGAIERVASAVNHLSQSRRSDV